MCAATRLQLAAAGSLLTVRPGHCVGPQQAYTGETEDHVFDETATNATVYDQAIAPVIKRALSGSNGTVFAYGMTGTGKTYSM